MACSGMFSLTVETRSYFTHVTNAPDFYLWEYLKDRVYGNNPQTIPDLKAAITAAISAVQGKNAEGSSRTLPAGFKRALSAGELIWITFFERQ